MSEPTSFQCRHIFTEGRQCGSPALRGEKLCYYHHAGRRPATHETIHGLTFVALPAPEDLHAIQRGLCEVMRLAAMHAIDDRHAGTLLRGLSICSANLARIARQQKNAPPLTEIVQDFVHDAVLGTLASDPELEPAASPQAPLPDCVPVMTPVPIIEYVRSPEADAQADALWAKAEQELAAYALAHPGQSIPEIPQAPADLPQTAHPVQTYPTANEDFGPVGKIIFMPRLTPDARVPQRRDSRTIAKVGV